MILFYIYVITVVFNLILFYILRYVDSDFKEEFEKDEIIFIYGTMIPLVSIILSVFLLKSAILIISYKIED